MVEASVHRWFRDRGVDVRYRPGLAYGFEAIAHDPVDDIRALKWLQSQVVGTLKRLGERYPRADLVAFLFDGASMEHMKEARAAIVQIERTTAERRELLRDCEGTGSATQKGRNADAIR